MWRKTKQAKTITFNVDKIDIDTIHFHKISLTGTEGDVWKMLMRLFELADYYKKVNHHG